eukprot:12385249-Alexandrium_andersonii.AAC.1
MAVAAAAWPAPSSPGRLAGAAGSRLHQRLPAAWAGAAAACPAHCCYCRPAWEAGRQGRGDAAAARPALGAMHWRRG